LVLLPCAISGKAINIPPKVALPARSHYRAATARERFKTYRTAVLDLRTTKPSGISPSFSGSDPSNTNTSGGRPDRICDGNLPASERTLRRWFDASCFVAPPRGRFGNAGTNILEGPGNHLHHISAAKTFDLTERWKFTFTAVAANAFNHPNFANPSANISQANTVGVIGSLFNPNTVSSRLFELRGVSTFESPDWGR
jgi:hypothetical protein